MSLLTLLPGTFCASVQKARKFRAAWRHARSARPSQKVYRQRSGPPPRVGPISPTPASPRRESRGSESSSAGAPSGGIPPANSEWLILRRLATRGRLLLAKAVEPHDLTATRGLVGVRVRPRSRRFGIGGDGHRHAGLRHGLVLRRWARWVTVLARGSALARLAGFLGFPLGSRLGVSVRHFFELQAKLHRRIEEAFHRRKGHGQPLRHAAERHADLEAALGHHEIPELVLQDDGHLGGILREHARR